MIFIFAIVFLLLLLNPLKRPELFFWSCITLFSDPGYYLGTYLYNSFEGGIKPNEIFFFLAFLPLLSHKYSIKEAFRDKIFYSFFVFLIGFQIYFIIIYGYITPQYHDRQGFLQFLIKQRLNILSVFILIPAYLVSKRNVELFLKITAFIGLVLLSVYFLSIVTNLQLVPWVEFERYAESGIIRKTVFSWGFVDLLIPFSMIILFLRIKTPYRKYLFVGGIAMVLTLFLTVTRSSIIVFWFQLFLIAAIASRYFKIHLSKVLKRGIIASFLLVIALTIFMPGYFGSSLLAFKDVYSLITNQTNSAGGEEQRISQDLPLHYSYIKQNPLLGVGYDYNWYSANDIIDSGSTDTPITAGLAMFGLVGILFYLIFYVKIIMLIFRIHKYFKRADLTNFNPVKIELVFMITIILSFISQFTIKSPALFVELIISQTRVSYILFLGILLGTYYRIKWYYSSVHYTQNININKTTFSSVGK